MAGASGDNSIGDCDAVAPSRDRPGTTKDASFAKIALIEAREDCLFLKKNLLKIQKLESLPGEIKEYYYSKRSDLTDTTDFSFEAIVLGGAVAVSYFIVKKRFYVSFLLGFPLIVRSAFGKFSSLLMRIPGAVRESRLIIVRDYPDVALSRIKFPIALFIRVCVTLLRNETPPCRKKSE